MSGVRSEAAPGYLTDDPREEAILTEAEAIIERRLRARHTGESITDPSEAGRFLKARLALLEREVFTVLFLDTRHRLIAAEDLFLGSVDGAEIHPREVAKRALALNAAAVVLGHNHPSGHGEPSAADRRLTDRLKQGLSLLDIRLLDHFVIGEGAPVSMAARGWI